VWLGSMYTQTSEPPYSSYSIKAPGFSGQELIVTVTVWVAARYS